MYNFDEPPNLFRSQFTYLKMERNKVISNITRIFEILSL